MLATWFYYDLKLKLENGNIWYYSFLNKSRLKLYGLNELKVDGDGSCQVNLDLSSNISYLESDKFRVFPLFFVFLLILSASC
jgi:hypothetical protein